MYVTHVANGEPQLRRDHRNGQFATVPKGTSRVATRTPLLTLVNRLYDVPPPSPMQLMVKSFAKRLERMANVERFTLPTIHRGLEYERAQWPHFAEEFVGYEHEVVHARCQLFADTVKACDGGRWQHLIGSDLVVPTNAMQRETAAALGWAISWLGQTRALAPADSTSTPALGLTAWLARLPARDQSTHRGQRNKQVLEWLKEDLRLSAWMWLQIARFMQAKGAYLLHGDMVNPQDLATARRTSLL